jgi:ZIP family zinc transporter
MNLDFTLVALGLITGVATLAGGVLALRLSNQLHLILGFSAGAVIGVALFDLLPEAIELGAPVATATAVCGAGFLAYLAADRAVGGETGRKGHLGAGGLTLHSLVDGLAIGLSFQVSAAVAAVVTLAVLAHDLCDGVNTVNVSLAGGAGRTWARRWLAADAAAPIIGILLSRLITVSRPGLALVLAAFAGAFLCLGAAGLAPASQARHPKVWTTLATIAGAIAIWLVVRLAGLGTSS